MADYSFIESFPIEDTIRKRRSIRTYKDQPLTNEEKEKLLDFAQTINSPFSAEVVLQLLHRQSGAEKEKLGTYGVIKGASDYVTAVITNRPEELLALGYTMEVFVLYAASIGLGTCWLGGTFNRGSFVKAVQCKDNEIIPIVSPVGHPTEKLGINDKLFRTFAQSAKRNPWETVFFDQNLRHPLTPEKTGDFSYPLEMVRIAPSAANKQPWRIVRNGNRWDFYKKKGAGEKLGFDMESIDLGIAISHFHLAVMDKGMKGSFLATEKDILKEPNMVYTISWQAD